MTRLLGSMMLLAGMTVMTGCDEYKLLRNVAGADFGLSSFTGGYSYYEPVYEYEEVIVEETYYEETYAYDDYYYDDYYYDDYYYNDPYYDYGYGYGY